jgi:UrcA family protein
MKNPYAIALVSALITASAIKAAPALAETPEAPQTYVSYVQTADLDLSNAKDQHTLDHRLAQAAREVCGDPSDVDLVGQNRARECRKDAIENSAVKREALLAAAKRGAVIAVTAGR